jgi:predicted  nucleic acid-binding Zn-ribbon protein
MAFNEASGRITALEMSLAEVEENYQQVSSSLGAANLKLEEVEGTLAENQQILEEVLF